jgi:hypothetical protein
VLKSIALLPNYSFCSFSSILSSYPHLPLPFSTNLSPDYLSILHTHHLLTNLPYQLYSNPPPAIPDTAPYTTTEIYPNIYKGHKTQQPPHHFPHTLTTHPASPFSATQTTPRISMASLRNVNPPSTLTA